MILQQIYDKLDELTEVTGTAFPNGVITKNRLTPDEIENLHYEMFDLMQLIEKEQKKNG